jgi:hypothetical protein
MFLHEAERKEGRVRISNSPLNHSYSSSGLLMSLAPVRDILRYDIKLSGKLAAVVYDCELTLPLLKRFVLHVNIP